MKTLIEHFSVLEDPRDIRGKKHRLSDILVMTVYGTLCGYTDFVNMVDFLELREEYFVNLLKLENGIPSHDCFSRVFSYINPKKFMKIFIEWIQELAISRGRFLSIDGKAIRAATKKAEGGKTPYILSGFLSEIGISIGQVKVKDKSNEITAIPELLDFIDIKDMFVTIDAIGTQEEIANKIIKNGGNFLLKVKSNQKELLEDITTYFDLSSEDDEEIIKENTRIEKNHGRLEKRKYFLTYNTSIISNKRKWPHIKAVGKVINTREINGKVTEESHYYIISKQIDIQTFKEATRSHWSIEAGLHWKLDVIMNEDHCTSRAGNSMENLSIIRKIVFNLARLDTSFGKKLTLRKTLTRYLLDFTKIENLIFNIIPQLNLQA
jgi:predicted transposase YbfD/YdcC